MFGNNGQTDFLGTLGVFFVAWRGKATREQTTCLSSVSAVCSVNHLTPLELPPAPCLCFLCAGGQNEKVKEGGTVDLRGARVVTIMFVNGQPQTAIELLEGVQKHRCVLFRHRGHTAPGCLLHAFYTEWHIIAFMVQGMVGRATELSGHGMSEFGVSHTIENCAHAGARQERICTWGQQARQCDMTWQSPRQTRCEFM